MKKFVAAWLFMAAVNLALFGGFIYVVCHFLKKFW